MTATLPISIGQNCKAHCTWQTHNNKKIRKIGNSKKDESSGGILEGQSESRLSKEKSTGGTAEPKYLTYCAFFCSFYNKIPQTHSTNEVP